MFARVDAFEIELGESLDEEPRYAVAIVAARSGVRVQTIRRWEAYGIVEPRQSSTGPLYSEADIADLQRVRRLTDDLGVNLAGVAAILHLRRQVVALQRETITLRRTLGQR
ncbi:MAG: MerR family transcriptional regulator [Thermomicrobiales bacterium]|nr:MerR family transcriptional regulator [Thermomicrobiales bacterium]